jgi:Superinfection immunity protein
MIGSFTPIGLVLLAIIVGLYFLPTIVATSRGVTNQGSVIVVNLFLGWTFIGWVVALAMAFRSVQPKPPQWTVPGAPPPPIHPPPMHPPAQPPDPSDGPIRP